MTPSHHIKQSRRQLKFATRDTDAGDHAATAVGIHWDLLAGLRGTRHRLQSSLSEMAKKATPAIV